VRLNSDTDKDIIVKINQNLDKKSEDALVEKINRMFRLDEDFEEFYNIVENDRDFQWILLKGAGRLIRCASLWEDMVKMLCTTNCTWRLTQIMTENLVKKLGKEINIKGEQFHSFPTVEAIALKSENFLRSEIKMGYRAPYLLRFAQSITNCRINLMDFENNQIPTPDLYKQLREIKGFGDYAVSNLLKLLGRYDYLGADSWSRHKFSEKHNKGKKCDDKKIEQYYKKFGQWSGLFFWMDVSEDWYQNELPW
jgi:N-glycosylase/DNA lyase